jgi:Ca2+-transporting ATPase
VINFLILKALRSEAENTPLQEKLNDLAEKIAKLGGAAALLPFIPFIAILISKLKLKKK